MMRFFLNGNNFPTDLGWGEAGALRAKRGFAKTFACGDFPTIGPGAGESFFTCVRSGFPLFSLWKKPPFRGELFFSYLLVDSYGG